MNARGRTRSRERCNYGNDAVTCDATRVLEFLPRVILELSINRRILIPRAIEFASHFNEQPRKSIVGELVCLARVVKRDNGRS